MPAISFSADGLYFRGVKVADLPPGRFFKGSPEEILDIVREAARTELHSPEIRALQQELIRFFAPPPEKPEGRRAFCN